MWGRGPAQRKQSLKKKKSIQQQSIVKLMIPGKYCMNNMDRCTCMLCFDFLKDIPAYKHQVRWFTGTIVVETNICGLHGNKPYIDYERMILSCHSQYARNDTYL